MQRLAEELQSWLLLCALSILSAFLCISASLRQTYAGFTAVIRAL